MTLKTSIELPLSVPIPVKGEDGKPASRDKLTLRRPKLRHAKALAALVGPEMANAFMEGDGADIDKEAFVRDILAALTKPELLDELTGIIADMCGETKEVIDDIDLADFPAIGMGFIDFFPALRSFVLERSQQTSPTPTDGDPKTSKP